MKDAERQTRSHLLQLFAEHGFHPRGDLGQNFLIDLNLLDYIAEQGELGPEDVVLEAGTGTGSLTARLAARAGAVVSVELDANMHALACEALAETGNVTLLNGDVLKSKNTLSPEVLQAVREKLGEGSQRQLKLVANLPYNVATPVVSNLVATDLPWTRMIVTIQQEIAWRMTARPGGSHYGALSAWLQAQCRLKILRKLKPTVFWPRPQVDSAVVRIVPDAEAAAHIRDRDFYREFLRGIFSQRRKRLAGVLKGMYRKTLNKGEIHAILQERQLEETVRAEQLEAATLVELANRLQRAVNGKEIRKE